MEASTRLCKINSGLAHSPRKHTMKSSEFSYVSGNMQVIFDWIIQVGGNNGGVAIEIVLN
jgi:hypothetical protein